MKKLHYVRHGQSEANKAELWAGITDSPLSAEGVEQAKNAGKKAKSQNLSFDVIVSSPKSRAHNTAKHIAAAIDYPLDKIIINDLFAERDFGILENSPFKDPRWTTDQSIIDNFEGVESVDKLFERAKKAHEFVLSLPHQRVLVVAHGNFGRAYRDIVNGKEKYSGGESFPHAEIFELL